MILQIATSAPLLLAGVIFIWISYRSCRGTLKPNFFIGIRTPETLASDAAWIAGHRAAYRYFFFGGIGLILSSVVALISPEDLVHFAPMAGVICVAVLLILGARVANRQAKNTSSQSAE